MKICWPFPYWETHVALQIGMKDHEIEKTCVVHYCCHIVGEIICLMQGQ